jgi:putative sterol carrier protein
MTLDEITRKLSKRVEGGAGLDTTLKFDFGPDGVIRIDDTRVPAVVDNQSLPTACTLSLALDDFKAIASGELNPVVAYMSGRLKVDDVGIAMRLGSLLRSV